MQITFWCSFLFCVGVTILLSLTVFLNMVAETMPATSDAVPLLGKYIFLILTAVNRFKKENPDYLD